MTQAPTFASTPTSVNRELLDAAVTLYHATRIAQHVLQRHHLYGPHFQQIVEAHSNAAFILLQLGGLEAEPPDAPEISDAYEGFGPMGPANADITSGADYAALYAHSDTCGCPSCQPDGDDGPEPDATPVTIPAYADYYQEHAE